MLCAFRNGLATLGAFGLLVGGIISSAARAEERYLSHPPLRPLPQPTDRTPVPKGAFFVDPQNGDDEQDGAEGSPWKTLSHALTQIGPGDTLCLRGGTYYERVYCAVVGTAELPITIRSCPGELATIDGSFREFFENPAAAWEPVADGAADEFQSKRRYKNLRNLHGRFGDSLIGLQVYYHLEDLRGRRYVGPGIWYDPMAGRIHVRLAHYEASSPIGGRTAETLKYLPHRLHALESYTGETDPRKLPLEIAPFHSIPLLVDQAKHVRFQDLVIRGGGHDTVDLRHAQHVEFENVTIYAGTYGLRAVNTGPLKLHNSAIFGSVPPWSTRGETSLVERPGQTKGQDLTRLNTHALLVPAAGDEYSVYYFPLNTQWEISYCDFADAHDGVYLGDVDGLRFHHNYVHNFQDDGVYLSSMRKMYFLLHGPRQIYQNVISGCIMSFAFGGDARLSSDVLVYRNLIDGMSAVSDHGGPPWEGMRWYHNTILANPRFVIAPSGVKLGQKWEVFNNLLLVGKQTAGKPQEGISWGGNVAADPLYKQPGDFRLSADSPAVDAGMPIPSDWPDPLRESEKGNPDAGAIPLGGERLRVGRHGQYAF